MNSHEHQMIRDGLQMHRRVLEESGFVVSVQQDGLQQWQTLVADAPTVANWCFRPDRQPDITSGNTLSFLIRDRVSGAPAAAIALRLYEAFEDLVDLVESGRMWFSVSRALEVAPPEISFPEDFPEARGRIFQLGGLVVWPGYQGKRVGWHLVRMIRWAGFQLFNADHCVGLELPKMAETEYMPLEYYGYQRVRPVARGIFMDMEHEFYMTHIARPEALDRLPGDLRRLEALLAADANPQKLVAVT